MASCLDGSEYVVKWPGSALAPSCVVADGGQFWPTHRFAVGSEPHCPSPGTHHRQAEPPPRPGAAGIWVQVTPGYPGPPATPPPARGLARSGLPPLPQQAEHDPNGGAFSKTKRCKIAF